MERGLWTEIVYIHASDMKKYDNQKWKIANVKNEMDVHFFGCHFDVTVLFFRFMKPPSSIKRGQRGARPGVPRKNRLQSLLQSQQSVNEEMSNSPQKDTGEHTPTPGPKVSTPYTVAHMPQFMASGTLKTPLQHMRPDTMGLAGMPLPTGNVAMLAGLPIVQVPSSAALHFNGSLTNKPSTTTGNLVDSKDIPQSVTNPVNISTKAPAKSPEPESNSNDTEIIPRDMSEQSTSDSEQDNGEVKMSEKKQDGSVEIDNATDKMENDEKKKSANYNNNKAVHLGMPIPVPTYNSNVKTKSKSLPNSLSKRRLMSVDGSAPKKIPRLILPKQVQSTDKLNNNVSEERVDGH